MMAKLRPTRGPSGRIRPPGRLPLPPPTVEQNVGFGLSRQARGVTGWLPLEMVGLKSDGAKVSHQLSGGQQQRVALARALAKIPQLVLLDEPFSVGSQPSAAVREEVRGILAETGNHHLLVTHDQEEALSIADQVAGALRMGWWPSSAPPPASTTIRSTWRWPASWGDANLVDGVVEGARVSTALGSLALRPAWKTDLLRRPGPPWYCCDPSRSSSPQTKAPPGPEERSCVRVLRS